MKIYIVALLFLSTTFLIAQDQISKSVGDFNEVKVYDLIKVNLIKSDQDKVVISGEDVNNVVIVNKNNKLKIRMKLQRSFNGNKTFIDLHYTDLKIIDANEGAVIIGKDLIDQDVITLKAQEGASILVGLKVGVANIKAISGGIIETRGTGNLQDVWINTGGAYEGKEFITQNSTIKIRVAGKAAINCAISVNASVAVGGKIDIYGNPKQVIQKKTLGGNITLIKD